MIPSHCESAVQLASRLPQVLATQEHVEGHAVVEQSTAAETATTEVARATDFMVKAT
jgi:hypothetical protein